jgi:hypothetical protein
MITISDTGSREAEASFLQNIRDSRRSSVARRAAAAATAVSRCELGLDQAAERYGIAAPVIEAWQRAIALYGLGPRRTRECLR